MGFKELMDMQRRCQYCKYVIFRTKDAEIGVCRCKESVEFWKTVKKGYGCDQFVNRRIPKNLMI